MKLMVVDDSNIIRRQIKRSLALHDVDIVADAANGVDALDCFRSQQPELVTMDLTMPELDGLHCIEQIMAINPQTRILVISAMADKATAIEALKKGAQGFLCKPFSEMELNEALQELIKDE
jgi:two-component system chemotaxis response regulator CheY